MALKTPKRPKWDEFVHLHDDKIIDRNLLTRKQHEDLLSTPRPAFGPPPAPPRGKKTPCKFPKIWPPRIDQLALPTVKAMESVLEHFNQTLEPMRIVRLVNLIHTKETERPSYTTKPKRKEPPKKKKKKRDKKKQCLKAWLDNQSKKSAKLIMNAIRERKSAAPNYKQLLVALSLMKAMKLKKKKHLPRYTQQYLMKICEQLAIICDTEWTPYKKIPEVVPLEPVESKVSRRHIFWKMRPFEEEEELEIVLEEEEEIEERIKEEEAGVAIKAERVSMKEEVPSITEISEEYGEEYPDYEHELEKELESFAGDKEAEGVTDFTTGEEGEEQKVKQEGKDLDKGEEGEEETRQGEGEEEGEDAAEGHPKEEPEGEEDGEEVKDEEDEPQIKEEEEQPGKQEGENGAEEEEEEATDEIEGGVKSEGDTRTEEGEHDTIAPEDTDFEALTDEEGTSEIDEEMINVEVMEEGEEEGEEVAEEEEIDSGEEEGEEFEEEEIKEKKHKKKEKPEEGEKEEAAESVEEHPPNTVSYLSWNIYSHWLEEFGRNIQIYGKCLSNFKAILEGDSRVQGEKIQVILVNWGTYLKESMQFEKNMTDYFKGKKMTKCEKCGDYTLYNIPEDHEIPDELKQAATSTGRWKKLLEEAEELCRSFSVVPEDTVSLVSHESIDITDIYATSETSMYVVEDYSPSGK